MLKVAAMESEAQVMGGLIKVGPKKYLFHTLHSNTLANLLHLPGPDVPVPKLFQHYGAFQHSMPLHQPDTPSLSLLRLLVSPHPYILRSTLVVCTFQPGVLTIFREPMITSADFPEAAIKLPCTLMMCSNQTMSDAAPATEMDLKALTIPGKKVIIDESQNACMVFEAQKKIKKKKSPRVDLCAQPGKPILKMSPSAIEAVKMTAKHYNACLFVAIRKNCPQLGSVPVTAFNTIMILSKSQNSLNFLPEVTMSPIQRMFLKHVMLSNMGMENSLLEFKALYDMYVEPITPYEEKDFEDLLCQSQSVLENIIFCLNSICCASFPKKVAAVAHPKILLAAEKYFLMFPPRDKPNAIPFAASIIEIICKGTSLSKVLSYMAQYMVIKECTPDDNLIKAYSLLTV